MIIQHHYKFNQRVWFYTNSALAVQVGNILNIEWDDESESYKYTISHEAYPQCKYLIDECCIRDTEYEAHDLLSDYLDISLDGANKTAARYQELLDKELEWLADHKDEKPDA